jgi:hemerythrin
VQCAKGAFFCSWFTEGIAIPKAKAKSLAVAHAALLKNIRKLEDAISAPQEKAPAAIHTLLEEVKKHIAEHFQFEEQGGYMDQVRERFPNKDGIILKLYKEHQHLQHSLDGLLQEARKPLDNDFREIVRVWIERIRHHESEENALIQETLNLEIGDQD